MSSKRRWIRGELSAARLKRARSLADRQVAAYPADRGDSRAYGGMPRDERIFQAAAASEFLAQVLGVDELPDEFKARWSSSRAENARLMIAGKEINSKPDRRWVLVAGRAPMFTVLGWILAAEAPEVGEWRDDALRKAWLIPWSTLKDPPKSPALVGDAS